MKAFILVIQMSANNKFVFSENSDIEIQSMTWKYMKLCLNSWLLQGKLSLWICVRLFLSATKIQRNRSWNGF